MKSSYKIIMIILSLIFLVAGIIGCSRPSNKELGRFAKKEEIIGFWKLEQLPPNVKNINKIDPWPLPHQWFGIYEDGKMYSYMTTKEENLSANQLDEIFQILPSSLVYTFKDGGFFVRNPDIKSYLEMWGVNYIFNDGKISGKIPVSAGDIIMTLQGPKEQGIVYYRHLKPVL